MQPILVCGQRKVISQNSAYIFFDLFTCKGILISFHLPYNTEYILYCNLINHRDSSIKSPYLQIPFKKYSLDYDSQLYWVVDEENRYFALIGCPNVIYTDICQQSLDMLNNHFLFSDAAINSLFTQKQIKYPVTYKCDATPEMLYEDNSQLTVFFSLDSIKKNYDFNFKHMRQSGFKESCRLMKALKVL